MTDIDALGERLRETTRRATQETRAAYPYGYGIDPSAGPPGWVDVESIARRRFELQQDINRLTPEQRAEVDRAEELLNEIHARRQIDTKKETR